MMNIDDIRGSVARGWCQPETSSKVMDPDLAEAIAQQVHADLAAAEAETARAVEAETERCAGICDNQAEVFGSDEYATGQPMSSFKERFACECIAAAIRTGAKP